MGQGSSVMRRPRWAPLRAALAYLALAWGWPLPKGE
jgi:hypothetical protein